jgi:hypothetical protein
MLDGRGTRHGEELKGYTNLARDTAAGGLEEGPGLE